MEEKFTFALRRIALLGGLRDSITVSSRELGEALEMSQQSASKRILELLDEKYIERDVGARKQQIRITPKGAELLKKEYLEYRKVFENTDKMVIHGKVAQGMGEGGYYICQPGYSSQIKELLGFTPFEGTFNLDIVPEDVGKLDVIRKSKGILINGFVSEGRTFGNVIAYKAKIKNLECAIVVPERSHYRETIEIICQYHIRRTLSLNDGDLVDVIVDL
jgi:riboflavin kinase